MITAWDSTNYHLKKNYELWNPLTAYLWLVLRVFAGRIWGFYRGILAKASTGCYLIHKHGGKYCGDLLLIPVFLVWAYWTILFPFAFKNYYVFIGSAPVCLFLTWMGYLIVKENWREPVSKEELNTPKLNVTGVVAYQAQEKLGFTFVGTKEACKLIQKILALH